MAVEENESKVMRGWLRLTEFILISPYRADELRGASCHSASGAAGRKHHERCKSNSNVPLMH